jgi:hypothetical protein
MGLSDLRPGDIGFGPLGGAAGKLAMLGEVICDGGFRVGKLNVGHVFMVTNPVVGSTYEMHAVEAMPNGAREVIIGVDRWTPKYAYARLPEDYPGQALDAAAIARAMIGTPYSFASYAALAAWRFGWKTPRLEAWINRRKPAVPFIDCGSFHALAVSGIAPPAEAICSVLADQSWALTGKQVMPEGTPHQCVTPSALGAALLEMPGAQWFWPR